MLQVMERAVTHADNVYNFPNVRITGRVCRTNLPSNTAFRGFGGPQGMMASEQLMDDVATYLGLPPEKVVTMEPSPAGSVASSNNVYISLC